MGLETTPKPVLLLLPMISRHDEAIDWAIRWAEKSFGPVAHTSPRFSFTETDYYQQTMGTDLKKCFVAFQKLIDPGQLATIKLATNRAEQTYAAESNHAHLRPLNLDPGYISLSKLVLASTKDHAHRIYLSDGIFAEITLAYRGKSWVSQPFTYPDYKRVDFQEFFTKCRHYLYSHS